MAVAGCSDGGGGICDPRALADALEGGQSGDVVLVGACRITGSFRVPAGVQLLGEGPVISSIAGDGSEPALTIEPGLPAAHVGGLSIDGGTAPAVVATGPGEVALTAVTLASAGSFVLGAEGLDRLTVAGADVASSDARGVVLVRVVHADLTGLSVRGASIAAATFFRSGVAWNGGAVPGDAQVGIAVHGESTRLAGVEVCGGADRPLAYAVVAADGADLTTDGLVVCDGPGFGLLHDGAAATHTDLEVRGMEDAAVWAQRGSRLQITGSTLEGNRLAGVVVLDTTSVRLADSRIAATALKPFPIGGGAVDMGDGIQLLRTEAALDAVLERLDLAGNARVGLVVDADGAAFEGLTVDAVRISGEGAALGAIAQRATGIPDGWDAPPRIERSGAVVENDASFTGMLDVVGIVMPPVLPPDLDTRGLDAFR